MFCESLSLDLNFFDNQTLFDFKEDTINEIKNNFNIEDEDDIKSNRELMYDIIQDNYAQMKNSLLILRRRLISEKDIFDSKKGRKPKYLLNNNIDENNKNIKEENSFMKKREIIYNTKKKYKHSKFSYDNMFYKIKVIYHNFLVDLANDFYNSINLNTSKNIFIRRISGQITQNKTIDFNKELAELNLKDFLSKSISSVYSNSPENSNKENIDLIYKDINKYQKLINLLNYKYKDFYTNYFIKDNCINLIEKNFHINITKRKYITFKENVDRLYEKESKEFIIKFIDFANYKFIKFLEGNRVNLKIIYDTKLKDLFVNNNS